MRRLPTRKILIATLGVGAVSYVVACNTSSTSGNLMAPQEDASAKDATQDSFASSGNLMAPDVATVDVGADISSSGNLMPIDSGQDVGDEGGSDAGDGGG